MTKYYSLIILLMISSQMVIAAKWSFPAPKNSQVEWVADNTQYNGINIKGRKFTSKRSVDSVLEFYRQLWDGNFAEIDYGPWRMISSKHDELFYTVQVKLGANGTGSMGILGVSDISEKLKNGDFNDLAKNFPKMSASEVQNDIKMTDPGKKGQVVHLTNKFSVASNVGYYKNYYQSRNWALLVDNKLGFSAPHTLVFNKGKERVSLVVSRQNGKTNVTANLVKKGLLSW